MRGSVALCLLHVCLETYPHPGSGLGYLTLEGSRWRGRIACDDPYHSGADDNRLIPYQRSPFYNGECHRHRRKPM